jgi:DNA-directed RNA polymerase subunit RPC12/RpoP
MIETQEGKWWVYRCERCGKTYRYAKRKAVIYCGHQPRPKIPVEKGIWESCPHRGEVVKTITPRVAGCSCTSAVKVYQCDKFAEPVIIQGKPPCEDSMTEQVPGWNGRICKKCPIPRDEENYRDQQQRLNEWAAECFGAGTGMEVVCEPSPMFTLTFCGHRILARGGSPDAVLLDGYAMLRGILPLRNGFFAPLAALRLGTGAHLGRDQGGRYHASIHRQHVGSGLTIEEALIAADAWIKVNGRPKAPGKAGCAGGG